MKLYSCLYVCLFVCLIWGLGSLAVLHTYMEVCVVILHVAKALQVKIIELFAQAWYAELSL